MKILNDQVTFDDTDIAQLSPALQKGLQLFVGTALDDQGNLKLPASQFLSDTVNAILKSAGQLIAKLEHDNFKDFSTAFVAADAATQAQVQPLLDQAALILGVKIDPPPAPAAADELAKP